MKLFQRVITLVIVAFAGPATLAAQSVTPSPSAPPGVPQSASGEWNASYNTPGGARTFTLTLVADGSKLTGTVKRPAGDSPLTGTIKSDTVTFSYVIQYNDQPLPLTITAIVKGDRMKGMVDFAGQASDTFEATRRSLKP